MADNFEMCPDKEHEVLEEMMELRKNIVDSFNEVNSGIVALALDDNSAICEQTRAKILELMAYAREKQNAPTELDALYLKNCLDRGTVNPDSFTQPDYL